MLELQHKLDYPYGNYINNGKSYACLRDIVWRGDCLDADIHLYNNNNNKNKNDSYATQSYIPDKRESRANNINTTFFSFGFYCDLNSFGRFELAELAFCFF
jgi:hypothetical protein